MRNLLVLLALVVGACGSSEDDGSASPTVLGVDQTTSTSTAEYAPCDDWLERPVTAFEVQFGCDQGGDDIAATTVYVCDDGRSLHWSAAGWGYVGEPMHPHAAGAEPLAPEVERAACPT